MPKTLNGIDILPQVYKKVIGDKSFALLTGSANLDSCYRPAYEVAKRLAGSQLRCLWSLQHGFFLDKQDNMVLSPSFFWAELGLQVRSLYGDRLLPQEDWLDGIDALMIDIVDVGTRVYTFVNHLVMVLRWLAGRNIAVIVLDRINPLNGRDCEGNVSTPGYFSIVGQLPVPMRHALTSGEYLSKAVSDFDLDLQLTVVKAKNWRREDFFSGLWANPSPNLPSLAAALVYPGAVLLEGTNISEGRGTTRPFELVGAPFIDPFRLRRELERLRLPGVRFIPHFFKPEFSKYAGQVCRGLLVHVQDRKKFRSFAVYYELIRLVARLYPGQFQWKQPPYEFEGERLPIDMICGSAGIRCALEKNIPFAGIRDDIERGIAAYAETVRPFLLYP